mgnify:CR=1 FL=1
MTFNIGDYVVCTPSKRRFYSESELYMQSYLSSGDYGNMIEEFKNQRVGIYIVTKLKNKRKFVATLEGELLTNLNIKDFQLATNEEKKHYQLKKAFKR